GSDFAWRWRFPGDLEDLRFIVDGEHRTMGIEVRRGVTPSLTLGARLAVQWRGGGILDGVIDWWHSVVHLPGNSRSLFPHGRFRVEAEHGGEPAVNWDARAGTGLGRAELSGTADPEPRCLSRHARLLEAGVQGRPVPRLEDRGRVPGGDQEPAGDDRLRHLRGREPGVLSRVRHRGLAELLKRELSTGEA